MVLVQKTSRRVLVKATQGYHATSEGAEAPKDKSCVEAREQDGMQVPGRVASSRSARFAEFDGGRSKDASTAEALTSGAT